MLKEFRDFINRGNVVDLAVAVVIGAAFTAIVNSLVDDIIMPFIFEPHLDNWECCYRLWEFYPGCCQFFDYRLGDFFNRPNNKSASKATRARGCRAASTIR